jgi:hypothetical protein
VKKGANLSAAVSAFGANAKSKLSNRAVVGAPEDQLRAPLETLIHDLAELSGLARSNVGLVGESTLSHLAARPDYAVTVSNALVGFIEVKAPGKGADPRRFSDEHDKTQWSKLKSLPNLLYTDGNSFGLWRDGRLVSPVIQLDGNVELSGASLSAPTALLPLITDFLRWRPQPPRNPKQLAEISARLCRLLRDEVTEELGRNSPPLTSLAKEWRDLLFPEATNEQFADGYAQAVTFGLLVARARGISLAEGIGHAALELRRSNSLIATALRLLTDNPDNREALKTSLDTLTRVLGVVDWPMLAKGNTDAWLYFYEDFLEVYDNNLRKKTGSYYTPPEVVETMTRLVDDALCDPRLFNRPAGLAAREVTIADPAVGTGTFLLGVMRRIASKVEDDQGPGAVGPAIRAAVDRLIGFELQFGPFAVAQLRLIAEMHDLIGGPAGSEDGLPLLKLFITNTLGDPYAEQAQFSSMVAPIGQSRAEANEIKRVKPITVVIGNPPYKEKAKGLGGWIESGSDVNKQQAAPLDRWAPPVAWGVSAHTKHLKNLYVYFWRWATLKVFGSGWYAATGEPDTDRCGIVCFITVAGFLNGPGFQKMRDDLRRDCADIWVIDCSPEGNRPAVPTRIFQGVKHQVCIVLAARTQGKDRETPARLHFMTLPEGRREAKFEALRKVSLASPDWIAGPNGWREPFLPARSGPWASFTPIEDMFVYNGSGVMPGRTWVIAPDQASLTARWDRLIHENDPDEKERLFHPHLRKKKLGDKHIRKVVAKTLSGHPAGKRAIINEKGPIVTPVRYAFRSLDQQWIIPDARLINQPNPTLWDCYSGSQIHLTCVDRTSPTSGPAITFTHLVPDLDHYNGRGGRVLPLWRDGSGSAPNVKPALLRYLSATLGSTVTAEDVMAYLAAVMAHPAFTRRFATDFVRPGLRVPITGEPSLFDRAVTLGREVIWLYTCGERFCDPAKGRPFGAPRMARGRGPIIPADGSIPGPPDPLPDTMDYDPRTCRLVVGKGCIDNVLQAVWDYEVSGKNVLRQWFSCRRLDRSRPMMNDRRPPSPLAAIQPDHWPYEYTSDLIDLLHVLGRLVALEPAQAQLLNDILAGMLVEHEALVAAGALATPPKPAQSKGKRKAIKALGDLF